jgi:DNA-binding CsgD family transcriptional regulator
MSARRGIRGSEPGDVLDVIELAYDVESSHAAWLRRIAESVYERLGQGLGLAAYYYRVTDELRIEVGDEVALEMKAAPPVPFREALGYLPPDFVSKSFVRCECATQSQSMDDEMRTVMAPMREALEQAFGARDVLMLGGMDPTGHGVYLGAWLPRETALPAEERAMWSKVAVHIVSAYRLRRSVTSSRHDAGADAVIAPSGKIRHAEGDAEVASAREALQRAVQRMETARGRLRKTDPAGAVDAWKGLVASRWSLLEQFERGGQRYIVARRNDATVSGVDVLSERERQAVGYAALRHSNKMIAYEMGLAANTVGVLLHRAAKKIGVASRDELIEWWTKTKTR